MRDSQRAALFQALRRALLSARSLGKGGGVSLGDAQPTVESNVDRAENPETRLKMLISKSVLTNKAWEPHKGNKLF